jgi:hypothetical protein
MNETMLRVVEVLKVNQDDDTASINAKTVVLRGMQEPNFKDILEMPASSQVLWFGANSDDIFLEDEYDDDVYETISSFLRILRVIKEIYDQEGQPQ